MALSMPWARLARFGVGWHSESQQETAAAIPQCLPMHGCFGPSFVYGCFWPMSVSTGKVATDRLAATTGPQAYRSCARHGKTTKPRNLES